MQISRQVYLFPAVVALWLGQIAISPVAAQTPAGKEPSSVNLAESPTSATRRNQLESVLGREVRTRVEEDMGRVIDLSGRPSGPGAGGRHRIRRVPGHRHAKDRRRVVGAALRGRRKQPVMIVEMTRNQLRVAPGIQAERACGGAPGRQSRLLGQFGSAPPREIDQEGPAREACCADRRRTSTASRPRRPHNRVSAGSTGSPSSLPTSRPASAPSSRSI